MINQSIFRSYDIRGKYPDEIDEKAVELIARAYVSILRPKKIIVGRDMRTASPQLTEVFIKTASSLGVQVQDIGLVPVDAFYYAVGTLENDGGVYCTASHNPKEYHGFKMFQKNFEALRGVDLKDAVGKPSRPATIAEGEGSSRSGAVNTVEIMKDFIQHILKLVDVSKIKPYKVVIDAGNGMASKTIPLLEPHLPIQVTRLNFELDGNFPAHPSNPLEPQSQKEISETVKKQGADLGVIFDGDSDRVFFVDENGEFVRADMTLLILARHYLNKFPGSDIVYNTICSRAVPEFIEKWGGKAHRSKVGFVNIHEAMKKHNAILGGELSAHYAFRDNFNADSGYIAMLNVLKILSESGSTLSKMVSVYQKYVKGNEVNIQVDDIPAKLDAIKQKYNDGKQDFFDGITVSYKDYWFNVRPSGTEPLLRITVEADTMELWEEKKNEIVEFVQNV